MAAMSVREMGVQSSRERSSESIGPGAGPVSRDLRTVSNTEPRRSWHRGSTGYWRVAGA